MQIRKKLAAATLTLGVVAGGLMGAGTASANTTKQSCWNTSYEFILWAPNTGICFAGTGSPASGDWAAGSYTSNAYHGFLDGNFQRQFFWYGASNCIFSSCGTAAVYDVNLSQS